MGGAPTRTGTYFGVCLDARFSFYKTDEISWDFTRSSESYRIISEVTLRRYFQISARRYFHISAIESRSASSAEIPSYRLAATQLTLR